MTEQEILDLINTNEEFSTNSLPDKKFTSNDLDAQQRLYVPDVFPGSICIVDAAGRMVMADQTERLDSNGACIGVYVDAHEFDLSNNAIWKVRYARGPKGDQGEGQQDMSAPEAQEEMIKYSILFS